MYQEMRKMILLVFVVALSACTLIDRGNVTEEPDTRQMEEGVAWVDFDSSQIIVKESFPMQVDVKIFGDMPTPCHELRWEITDPDENKYIHIRVYSEFDASVKCVGMLESFTQLIPLGDFEDTGYSIWINDYKVGEF